MNNSSKKRYFSWFIKAVLVALGSLLPAHLTADNGLSLSDSSESQATTVSTEQDTTPVRHTIRFPAQKFSDEDLATQFFHTLSLELAEHRSWIWATNDPSYRHQNSTSQTDRMHQQILVNGEKKPMLTVMREQASKALSRAAAETVNATSWGREVKAVEEKLSRYFVIAFSKNRFDATADLHLPGEASPANVKLEKEYAVSLSSSFYADLDAFEGDYTLTLDAVFHDYQFQAEYDFGSSKLGLRIENNRLDHMLGGNAALSFIKHPDAPAAYLLSFSWRRY